MAKVGLNIPLTASSTGVKTGTREAETYLDRFHAKAQGQFQEARHSALGFAAGLIGGAGVVEALKSTVATASEAEAAQASLSTQLKAQGISWAANRDEIEKTIRATSELSGLTDKDLTGAFTNLVRATGDVKQSMGLLSTAADVSRAKHLDVAKAAQLLGKVADGNVSAFSRYGVAVAKGTSATDALGQIQQKFSGQAEAYGKTTAGSLDRVHAASERLQETVGQRLAPHLATAANKLADFLDQMSSGKGTGGEFAHTLKEIVTPLADITKFLAQHPKLIRDAGAAWLAYKIAAKSALAVSNFKTLYAKLFGASVPIATAEGAAAGEAYSTSFAATSSTGVAGLAKGGRLVGAFRTLGVTLGAAMGYEIATQVATDISDALGSFHAAGAPGQAALAVLFPGSYTNKSTAGAIANQTLGITSGQGSHFVTGGNEGGITTAPSLASTLPSGRVPTHAATDVGAQSILGPGIVNNLGAGGGSGGGHGGGSSAKTTASLNAQLAKYGDPAVIKTIFAVGQKMGASQHVILAALAAGIDESGLRNLHYGDRDSQGVFQQRPSQGWGSVAQVTDPAYAAAKFFEQAIPLGGKYADPASLAQAVQRSGTADGSNYRRFLGSAGSLLSLLTAGGTSGSHQAQVVARIKADVERERKARQKAAALRAAMAPPALGSQAAIDSAVAYAGALQADPELAAGTGEAGFAVGFAKLGEVNAVKARLRKIRRALRHGRLTQAKRVALEQEIPVLTDQLSSLTTPADSGAAADSGTDPNQPLIDSNAALTDALKAQTDALTSVSDEVKRGNDLQNRIATTDQGVLLRALSAASNGQIGSTVLGALGTPGYAGQRSLVSR